MKKTLQEFLIAQDHFGITPSFMHKGRYQYHSLLCEILSLCMNLGCLAMFITLLVELTKKNKPAVNHVSLQQSKGPNGTLNSEDLIVSFGILDQNYQIFNDPTYLTFEATYEVDTIENGEFKNRKTKMNQINCTEINLNRYEKYGYQDIFLSNSLANYYCYDKTDIDDKIIIGGIFGSEFYGCIHAILKKCQNSSDSNIICKSEEEINEKINGFWFEMFFLDHFVDIYNYSSPIQTFSNSLYSLVSPEFYKSLRVYYNGITVKSDVGLLLDKIKEEDSFKYEKMTFDLIGNNHNDNLVEFILISSFTEEVYNREYLKIQGVFTNVGGILNGMLIAGMIILSFFELKGYQIEIIDSLFTFTTKKEKNISLQGYNKNRSEKMYELNETPNKEVSKKRVKFNLSLKDILCIKSNCFSNERTKIFKNDIDEIQKETNKKLEFCSAILIQNNVFQIEKILKGTNEIMERTHKFQFTLGKGESKEKWKQKSDIGKVNTKLSKEFKEKTSIKETNYSIQNECVNNAKLAYLKNEDNCQTNDNFTDEKTNVPKQKKGKRKTKSARNNYCNNCNAKINKSVCNNRGLCDDCYKEEID